MDPQVRLLFHELADLPPGERERILAERQIAPELRCELESLLSFDAAEARPLTECVAGAAEEMTRYAAGGDAPDCGPYRLVRLLGRGGMGAVYLGQRTDGEIQQTVAVKLLNAGDQRPGWRDRFLKERQLLAFLNHPSVVHVIDAGRTGDGRPYLVMEYVEGVSIDLYAARLDVRERLTLFLSVCEGVSHAHRRLIIHRDLKPSNILVDTSGRPKLLDFGIAKLLDDTADATQTVERLLTPNYASPEQLRGASQTTATDIYSLGAVLYRILTGRSPHESESSATQKSGGVQNHKLPGDLDYILRKALRIEPEERYASVDAFANDIRAFLESRPVEARTGDTWYRTRKFLRRYWIPVVAASVVIASLSAGLYIANRERAIAQRRFTEVRQLAHTVVFDLHDEIAKLEGSTKAREIVVATGLQYLDNLAKNAAGDLELQAEIAGAYVKIGEAQGYPDTPTQGRFSDAMASYRKAGDLYRQIAARNPRYLPDLADYYVRFAGLVRNPYPIQERDLAQSAIEAFDRSRAYKALDLYSEYRYVLAWCTLGDGNEALGDYQKAAPEYSRCSELARARLSKSRDLDALRAAVHAAERSANLAAALGSFTQALRSFDEEEPFLRELVAAEPRNPLWHRYQAILHQFRSRVYYDDRYPNLGDPAHALESARRYLDASEQMIAADPQNISAQISRAIALNRVSYSLREFDPDMAIGMARESVHRFDQMIASGQATDAVVGDREQALVRLGEAQMKAGRAAEARRSAESALAVNHRMPAQYAKRLDERMSLVITLILDGQAAAAMRDFATAESLLQQARAEAQELAKRQELTSLVPLAQAEQALGCFYAGRRRTEEARACFLRLMELWQRFARTNEYVEAQRAVAARLAASLP